MPAELKLLKDQDCPKCGYPETILVVNPKTGAPIRWQCSTLSGCDWTQPIKTRKDMPRPVVVYPYNGEPLSLCRFGCGKQIYFVKTAKSRPMPVSFETKQTHFADCTEYERFRKLKQARNRRPKP